MNFVDLVKDYSQWKLKEKGNGKLTKNELVNLRETFKAKQQAPQMPKALKEKVDQYKAWKKAEKGTDKITRKEFEALKESLREGKQSWEQYLANYKKFKITESKNPNAKITYKELKMLKENWKEASEKKIRLREADAGFDPAAAAPAPGDPNAMGADPNAAGAPPAQVDPTVAAQIQDVLQSVNALAASAGVQVNTLGADPSAGMPAVDGMQQPGAAADPNGAQGAAPGAPMMEAMVNGYKEWKKVNKGTDKLTEAEIMMIAEQVHANLKEQASKKSKYEQIKERIAARQEKLKALNEGYLDIPTTQELGTLTSPHHSNSQGGDHTVSEEQVKVPTPTQLANGYTSGKAASETKPAKTWPTKAVGKEAGGALQGAGATQTKVKECGDACANGECDEEKKLEEKKLEEKKEKTVTEVYVENYLSPKLDFSKIKESMKSGLLG